MVSPGWLGVLWDALGCSNASCVLGRCSADVGSVALALRRVSCCSCSSIRPTGLLLMYVHASGHGASVRSRSGVKLKESRYHVGIMGNEKTDRKVKSATAGHSKRTDLPPYVQKIIKSSTSVLKKAYNKNVNKAWKKEYVASDRHKRLP